MQIPGSTPGLLHKNPWGFGPALWQSREDTWASTPRGAHRLSTCVWDTWFANVWKSPDAQAPPSENLSYWTTAERSYCAVGAFNSFRVWRSMLLHIYTSTRMSSYKTKGWASLAVGPLLSIASLKVVGTFPDFLPTLLSFLIHHQPEVHNLPWPESAGVHGHVHMLLAAGEVPCVRPCH